MPRRKAEVGELQLLTARLEASQAQLEVQTLQNQVRELQAIISQYQDELRECRRLLLKQRLPRRPFSSSSERQLIAAGQGWRCGGYDDCPLKKLNGGLFDKSLFVIEHLSPWAASGRHVGNRSAWCHWCSAVKTRQELADGRHKPSVSGGESDGADDE
jgi:hypothetical protein